MTSTFFAYFEAFSKQVNTLLLRPASLLHFIPLTLALQYRRGSTRTPGAWTAVASRIRDELDDLKRKILRERKKVREQKQAAKSVSVDGSFKLTLAD